jgi:hypothetical protein
VCLKNIFAVLVAVLLAVPLPAQQPVTRVEPGTPQQPAAATAKPGPAALKIVVLEGEGARNDVRSGIAVAPRVQVLDENGKSVPDAEVVFRLPMEGPSGVFHGWVKTQTVRTNADGVAAATGYTPNETEGRFNIRVTVKAGTQEASAVIAQSNIRGSGAQARSSKKWWILAAIGAGAGAAIGAAAASGNGSSGVAATTPVTITAGPVTVAGPR